MKAALRREDRDASKTGCNPSGTFSSHSHSAFCCSRWRVFFFFRPFSSRRIMTGKECITAVAEETLQTKSSAASVTDVCRNANRNCLAPTARAHREGGRGEMTGSSPRVRRALGRPSTALTAIICQHNIQQTESYIFSYEGHFIKTSSFVT